MSKTKTGFKRQEREGKKVLVKTLPNGAEITKSGDEFYAYDTRRNYLGFASSQEQAEYMASNGYPNIMDDASELSLWEMWNDAINSGEKPLEDKDGTQFLSLGFDTIMFATKDAHGWDVGLMNERDFWIENEDPTYDILALTVAPTPFRLE